MSLRFARIPEQAIRCRDLSAADWRVLACISLHADGLGQAFPSMATISRMTGVDRKHIPRAIGRLEREGLLLRKPSGPNGTNVYTLTMLAAEIASGPGAGVPNPGDRECPQPRGQGVPNSGSKVSPTLGTKHTKEQTNEQRGTGDDGADQWFERFWAAYPDRGDKTNPRRPAFDKFKAALKRGVDPAAIIRGAENYRRVMERHRGDDRQYVKQAVGWLTSELWEQYQASANPARPKFGGMV